MKKDVYKKATIVKTTVTDSRRLGLGCIRHARRNAFDWDATLRPFTHAHDQPWIRGRWSEPRNLGTTIGFRTGLTCQFDASVQAERYQTQKKRYRGLFRVVEWRTVARRGDATRVAPQAVRCGSRRGVSLPSHASLRSVGQGARSRKAMAMS